MKAKLKYLPRIVRCKGGELLDDANSLNEHIGNISLDDSPDEGTLERLGKEVESNAGFLLLDKFREVELNAREDLDEAKFKHYVAKSDLDLMTILLKGGS